MFDKNNTQPDNNIYDNNVHNVSEENDNIDLDYSEKENDENTITHTDHQLSSSTNWAERTGNWDVYLLPLSQMLNLFVVTGNIIFAKSARLHLQNMLELETNYA